MAIFQTRIEKSQRASIQKAKIVLYTTDKLEFEFNQTFGTREITFLILYGPLPCLLGAEE